jgi:mitochondrial ornithine carrier protein
MTENATLFLTYNRVQSFFKSSSLFLAPQGDSLTFPGLVIAGGISGACTSYILTPIELIKCKLQVQNVGTYASGTTTLSAPCSPAFAGMLKRGVPATSVALHTLSKPANNLGPIELIQEVYRIQGIMGFWRGQMGTFLRETGGSAAWFGTYEYVSSIFKSRHPSGQDLPATDLMVAGACAGMAYNLILFPADSVKSCMQTDSISEVGRLRGFLDVGREMWQYGGVRVFYRGCLITVLRAAPASAVIFWTYENLKKMVL